MPGPEAEAALVIGISRRSVWPEQSERSGRSTAEGAGHSEDCGPTLSETGSHWWVLHSAGTWPDLNSNGDTLAAVLGVRGKGQSR